MNKLVVTLSAVFAMSLAGPSAAQDTQQHRQGSSSALGSGSMDLPMGPPTLARPIPSGPPEEDPQEDPRDAPPPVFYGEEIDTETDSIYYVIDRSCSMGGGSATYVDPRGQVKTGTRMERAKAEVIKSVNGLSSNFHFNIVAYDCSTRQWKPTRQQASEANKKSAQAWLAGITPGGMTGTGPATALALGDKENLSVILLTDGRPNCGAGSGSSGPPSAGPKPGPRPGPRGPSPFLKKSNPFGGLSQPPAAASRSSSTLDAHRRMIRDNNTQGATINVFGIAASGTYRTFCQNVAADSGGTYTDLP